MEVKEQERDAQSAFPPHNEKRETNLCKKSFNGRSWNFRRAINRYERRMVGGATAVKRKILPLESGSPTGFLREGETEIFWHVSCY